MSISSVTAPLRSHFSFPLRDRSSRARFLGGSALLLGSLLVPIVPLLLVYGYGLRVARRTIAGEPPEMIPWDDWSGLLWLGFRGFLASLVYTLPGLFVFALGMGLYFVASIAMTLSAGPSGAPSDASAAFFLVALAAMFLSLPLGTMLLILGVLPLPAALCHFAATDRLTSAFAIDEWWPILSANRLGYAISFVITAGVFGLTYWLTISLYYTIVLACVAALLSAAIGFYTLLLGAAVFGDAYREGKAAREEAAAAAPALP